MDKHSFKATYRAYRAAHRDLPVAADGSPQWAALDHLWAATPQAVQYAAGGRPCDLLVDRQWLADHGCTLRSQLNAARAALVDWPFLVGRPD
jgi:hypothetical protein